MQLTSLPTEAQLERLALLIGEASEVNAEIVKIIRFGYDSYHPNNLRQTNLDRLNEEIGHLLHAIDLLSDAGDLDISEVERHRHLKRLTVGKYLKHQSKYR